MKWRAIFAAISVLLFSTFAIAADWKEVCPTCSVYVDVKSVRRDTFPHFTPGMVHGTETATYRVAWVRLDQQEGAVLTEVVFNCHGAIAVSRCGAIRFAEQRSRAWS